MTESNSIHSIDFRTGKLRRSILLNGAIVAVVNLAALLLSLVLARFTSVPYLFFIPAVWLGTWYGGVWGEGFSILAAVLGLHYIVPPPLYSLQFGDLPGETTFVLVAVAIGMIAFDRRKSFEMRHRMEAIVNSSEDAIVGITPEGNILNWNKGAGQIYEYSADEAIGRPILTVLPPPHSSAIESVLEQIKRGGAAVSFEAVHAQKDGALLDLLVHVSSVRHDDGKVSGATIIARDISRQKRTQEWLTNLSDAVENTSDIVLITDRQGVIEYVNPAFQSITGYSNQEALGQTPRLLKSDLHPPAFYDKLWNTIISGQVFRAEFVNRRKNGELFYALETIAPVRDRGGEIIRFVCTGKDITERVLSGQLLQQQVEERTRDLSTLYDITTISSGSLDLSVLLERSLNRILSATSANNGAVYLLDETRDALNLAFTLGNGFRRTITLSKPEADVSPIRQVALDNKPYTAIDTVGKFLDGPESIPEQAEAESYAIAVVPISVEAHVIGALATFRAKTRPFLSQELDLLVSIGAHLGISIERIRLIADTQKRATLAERERLAHELHDSVTQNIYSVSLLAEASRRHMATGDAPTASRYLARLGELSQRSLKEMRLLVYQLRPLALTENSLVDAMQQRLDAVEKRSGVDARFEHSENINLPGEIEEALYRVAQEALNNSLTHSTASSVAVLLYVDAKRVVLKVKDNGKGFDADNAVQNGAGVGLGSMKKRIERLGGELAILSKSGEGTQVIADLPLIRDREEING